MKIIRGKIEEIHILLNEYTNVITTPDGRVHYLQNLLEGHDGCPIEILIYNEPQEWSE